MAISLDKATMDKAMRSFTFPFLASCWVPVLRGSDLYSSEAAWLAESKAPRVGKRQHRKKWRPSPWVCVCLASQCIAAPWGDIFLVPKSMSLSHAGGATRLYHLPQLPSLYPVSLLTGDRSAREAPERTHSEIPLLLSIEQYMSNGGRNERNSSWLHSSE